MSRHSHLRWYSVRLEGGPHDGQIVAFARHDDRDKFVAGDPARRFRCTAKEARDAKAAGVQIHYFHNTTRRQPNGR